jgi:hypothetical protein
MEQHLLSYYLGIIIIIVNSFTLMMGNMTNSIARLTGVFNIIGFLMIAYYFMYKEKLL